MSTSGSTSPQATFEECVDELNELAATLDRYPRPLLAFAMRAHLSSLLQMMLEDRECTRQEVLSFVMELEQEILQPEEG